MISMAPYYDQTMISLDYDPDEKPTTIALKVLDYVIVISQEHVGLWDSM